VGTYCDDPNDHLCQRLKAFLDQNMAWMESQIEANQDDPYHVALFLEQLSGLGHGYYGNNSAVNSPRSYRELIGEPKYFKLL
jgi:hypothetical protein